VELAKDDCMNLNLDDAILTDGNNATLEHSSGGAGRDAQFDYFGQGNPDGLCAKFEPVRRASVLRTRL
jgi:hypothetical protein